MEIHPGFCSNRCMQTSGHKISLTSITITSGKKYIELRSLHAVECSHFPKLSGYNVTVAEKALIVTKNEGVQPAIDW